MNISQARQWIIAVIFAITVASHIPIGIAGASSRDTVDAGHLTPSGKVFELFALVLNGEDPNAASALIADDAVLYTPYGEYVGPEGVIDYVAFVKRSYPDAEFHITRIATRGNTVEVDWTMMASRIHVDPYEQPVAADITILGHLTLDVTDTEIAGMSQVNESIAFASPVEIAYASRADR